MKLGDFFVMLTAKGVSETQRAIASTGESLKTADKAAEKLKGTLNSVGGSLSSAFKFGTAGVLGFATAGIAASVQGERLKFQLSLLAREVAGVFVPVVDSAIKVTSKITDALRGMSGETQGQLLKWAGLAGGITMVATGIGTLPGLFVATTSAASILGDVLGEFSGYLTPLKEMFSSAFTAVLPELKELGAILRERVVLGITTLGSIVQSVMPGIVAITKQVLGVFVDWGKFTQGLLPIIATVAQTFAAGVGFMLNRIAVFVGTVRQVYEVVAQVGRIIVGVVSTVWSTVGGIIGGAARVIYGVVSTVVTTVAGLWTSVGSVIYGVVSTVVGAVATAAKAVWQFVDSWTGLFTVLGVVKDVFMAVFGFIADKIMWVIDKVSYLIRHIKEAMDFLEILTTGKSGPIPGKSFGPGEAPVDREKTNVTPKGGGFGSTGVEAFKQIQTAIHNTFSPEKDAKEKAKLMERQIAVNEEIRDELKRRPGGAGV